MRDTQSKMASDSSNEETTDKPVVLGNGKRENGENYQRALTLGTFRSDYDYEYEYDFLAREAWVLAVVDTVVAVVSSQQKYFSNFCEYY